MVCRFALSQYSQNKKDTAGVFKVQAKTQAKRKVFISDR